MSDARQSNPHVEQSRPEYIYCWDCLGEAGWHAEWCKAQEVPDGRK